MKKVFISSTYKDLIEYRDEVKKAIEQSGLFPIDMKNFGNRHEEPKEVCFQEIDNCDIMIGIYAHRYGFVPTNEEFSITEMEFDYAKENGKIVICYFIDEKIAWLPEYVEKSEKLAKFKEKVSINKTCSDKFTNKESLKSFVIRDLIVFREESNINKFQPTKPIDNQSIINQYLTQLSLIYSKFDTLSGEVSEMKMNQFDLYDVYFPVTLSPEKPFEYASLSEYTIENLGGQNPELTDLRYEQIERERKEYKEEMNQSMGFFLKKTKKLVVLGSSGQGKTILCNWLMTSLSDKRIDSEKFAKLKGKESVEDLNLLPIILKCRSIGNFDFPHTLDDIIRISLKDNGFSKEFIETFIPLIYDTNRKEELLLIIDGLDEIDTIENLGKFSELIQDLSEKFSHCYFVLTSRFNSYKDIEHKIGAGFKSIVVDELDNEKQKLLVGKFSKIYNLPEETPYKILGNLNGKHTEAFIKTPLILTNICLIYLKKGIIPERVDELYDTVLELMFKRVGTQNRLSNCSDNDLRRLLAWIAYELCKENKEQFNDLEFKEFIKIYKEKNDLDPNFITNPIQLLNYLCQRVGVFNFIGLRKVKAEYRNFYEFKHRSFKEFLGGLSLALVCNSDVSDKDNFVSIMNKHLKKMESAFVKYDNRKVHYLEIEENWIEPISFAMMLADKEDTIALLEDLIIKREEYSQAEYESRVVFAAKTLCEITEESYYDVAGKVIRTLALCLNDDDNLNSIIGNTPRNILLNNEFVKSIWKDLVFETLLDLSVCKYQDADCSYQILLTIINKYFVDDMNYRDTSDFYNDSDKILWALQMLDDAFRNRIEFEELDLIKNKLFDFSANSNKNVALVASWALFWLAGGRNIDNGIWVPDEDEIKNIESILFQSNSENADRYLLEVLLKAKGYIRSTIVEGEKILWKNVENLNFQVKDRNLLNIISQKIPLTKGESNLMGLFLAQVKLCYLNFETAKYLLENVEKVRPASFVNEVIPYLIKYNSEEIFELLFALLGHENQSISTYARLVLTKMSNSQRETFLRKKYPSCSEKIRIAIDTILDSKISKGGTLEKNDETPNDKVDIFNDDEFKGIIINAKKDNCFKVTGVDITGRDAWYFVLIYEDKKESFLEHKNGDSYNLEDYGKIIISGYGKEIPVHVKEMLKEKYDFDNF